MTDLVWGINRGHPTNRRVLAPRPANRKAVASERVQTIRSVVREVAGFAPYERRAMELIRNSKVCTNRDAEGKPLGNSERSHGWFGAPLLYAFASRCCPRAS